MSATWIGGARPWWTGKCIKEVPAAQPDEFGSPAASTGIFGGFFNKLLGDGAPAPVAAQDQLPWQGGARVTIYPYRYGT